MLGHRLLAYRRAHKHVHIICMKGEPRKERENQRKLVDDSVQLQRSSNCRRRVETSPVALASGMEVSLRGIDFQVSCSNKVACVANHKHAT